MGIKNKIRKNKELLNFLRYIRNNTNRFFKPIKIGEVSNRKASEKMGTDRGLAIDRYYIEKFLKMNKLYIKGNLLEIADSEYSEKYSQNSSTYNILTYDQDVEPKANLIVGDLTNIKTLKPEQVDCFICTQTLNFIYDVKAAIEGIKYVLKNGGVVLCTVSGLSQISPYDYPRWGDYWRFTDKCIKRLFEDVFGEGNVTVESYGNLASTMAFLQGMSTEDIKDRRILDKKDVMYQCIIGIIATKK